MPNSARVLSFPARARAPLSAEEARSIAFQYLETPTARRADGWTDDYLREPDVLLALCTSLKEKRKTEPAAVETEAAELHQWIRENKTAVGLFDERDYFLGETALLAGTACCLLGKRDEAELWLERAEASFRHTINSGPQLANVCYARLTIHYEARRFDRVLELLPSLTASFEKLRMQHEVLTCRLLGALSLKEAGRHSDAVRTLESLRDDPAMLNEPSNRGSALIHLGELLAKAGRHPEAVGAYQEALPLIANQSVMLAHLKASIAEGLRDQGLLQPAIESYRAAISEYSTLGMATFVAYLRVVLSETLIAASRYREAEWEILAALPTIEEQKMVPEGFAAVALLKESVRRRKTDPNALRELREHLQASK